MSNPLCDMFERYEDDELLTIAAFFPDEYTQEGLAALNEVASGRGITAEAIAARRAGCWPGVELYVQCESCDRDLRVTRQAFVDGWYSCPECEADLPLRYLDLAAPPSIAESLDGLVSMGSIWGEVRNSHKRAARRKAIERGEYWEDLRRRGWASGE